MKEEITVEERVNHHNSQFLLQCALQQETIRTLTMVEPWATLVASGAKKQETRTWNPHSTGLIAIQSSVSFTWDDEFYCRSEHFRSALAAAGYRPQQSRSTKG